jgi:hypothetical protein
LETVLKNVDKQNLTPLWIVAIFVSLAETVLGVLVAQTTSFVQLILTLFVVTFPAGVALAFFLLLCYRPHVLYAPWQWKDVTMYEAYRGVRVRPGMESANMYEVFKEGVEKIVSDSGEAEKIVRSIQSKYITIDTTPLIGEVDGSSWTAPYSQFKSVEDLLDTIWVGLPHDRIKPYTYGKSWIIKDVDSGKVFDDFGSQDISLAEVGINSGMKLQVIPATKRRKR